MIHFTLATWLWLAFSVHTAADHQPDWGFFGHRKINKMAIFTLPEEMLPLYKTKLDYLEEHAVDPDKRRYATPFEAIRHYIDLDQWGQLPLNDLPREWNGALALHSSFRVVTDNHDTLDYPFQKFTVDTFLIQPSGIKLSVASYLRFFRKRILPQYFEENWTCPIDTINKDLGLSLHGKSGVWTDTLSAHGILPYYLPIALDKLTRAFVDRDERKILQYSAEIGHYIGDAHVPLHTTKNYNGQLTGQQGIHAFWESRLPELFADTQYDFLAGKATYIKDPVPYFWNIIFESHQLLPAVLEGEKRLSQSFPQDNQFCYDERLGQTVRIQCREYAKAYHDQMSGMVEDRMKAAIQAIGSAWYTAWVNAGQPDLAQLSSALSQTVEKDGGSNETTSTLKIKIRDHEN